MAEQKYEVVTTLLTGYKPGDTLTMEDAGGQGPIDHLLRSGAVKKATQARAASKTASKGEK